MIIDVNSIVKNNPKKIDNETTPLIKSIINKTSIINKQNQAKSLEDHIPRDLGRVVILSIYISRISNGIEIATIKRNR
tara:strand:+ start:189 stop:422 length:234 start_codon:yes stop_codon:yes gene_type:complete